MLRTMDIAEVEKLVEFAQELLDSTTHDLLTDLEKSVLKGAIADWTYDEIELRESTDFSSEYLRRTVSPKLRKKLLPALKAVGVVDAKANTIVKKDLLRKLRQAWLEDRSTKSLETRSPHPSTATEAIETPLSAIATTKTTTTNPPKSPRIYQNLPTRDHTTFIGHEKQLQHLLKLLSWESRVHRIGIEGIGGAGKTTLIVEAAYRCLESKNLPNFEAIIFTSAKPHRLTGTGILPRLKKENTLSDICRTIARTLQCHDLLMATRDRQIEEILDCLTQQRTLLIVDNLETASDLDQVRSFLYELPPTVKVAIASRQQALLDVPIHLESFSKKESLRLIYHHAEEKNLEIVQQQAEKIYATTGGIPAAIVYTIGQLSAGYPFSKAIAHLNYSHSEIARYCFQDSIIPLRQQTPHLLLMALAIFPSPALPEAVCEVADVSNHDAFVPLQQLSLVKLEGGRYQMLPLTRGYVLAELQAYPLFQTSARDRWVNWYLKYSKQYGNTDAHEWSEYQELDREWDNLSEAIEWTILQNRYQDFGEFWKYLKGYTHFAGYWSERLRWMDWWRETAEKREDWLTMVEALRDKSRTLILVDRADYLAQAHQLLERAWQLCQIHQLPIEIDLALDMTILQIHQRDFRSADRWFSKLSEIQARIDSSDSNAPRRSIQIDYYRGEFYFNQQKFIEAQKSYEKALQKAQDIGWHRAVTFLRIWLALVAIEVSKLDRAESLLEESFPSVNVNGDRRCLAFCKRAFALLKKAQGDWIAAKRWAASAREDFRQLLMRREMTEMDDFLSVKKF